MLLNKNSHYLDPSIAIVSSSGEFSDFPATRNAHMLDFFFTIYLGFSSMSSVIFFHPMTS